MPKLGFITASSFADLMTNGRGKDEMGKTALKVVDQLVLDIMGVERREEHGTPAPCQWGIDHESDAIEAYQERSMREVLHPVEFRAAPDCPYVGGTMDGLVGKVGGVEVKCPYNSTEHLYNLQCGRQLKEVYWFQVQGYFWIYELEWIDFISYDPRFAEPDCLYIERAFRDEPTIARLKARCEEAHDLALRLADEIRKGAR